MFSNVLINVNPIWAKNESIQPEFLLVLPQSFLFQDWYLLPHHGCKYYVDPISYVIWIKRNNVSFLDHFYNLYGEIETGSSGPCNSGPSSISIPGILNQRTGTQQLTKFQAHLLWGGSLVLEICQRHHFQADTLPLENFCSQLLSPH